MRLRHGRVGLELHRLRDGQGMPLLLLHELYGSSADWNDLTDVWPGPVRALDFCGHGKSEWLVGGAYCSELLLGDADVALGEIGRAVVVGKGVGAYVALLLAGARNGEVYAAVAVPGAGEGGGAWPDFEAPAFHQHLAPPAADFGGVDPHVRNLQFEVRPLDYVEPFAREARNLCFVEDGTVRPPWWEAARKVVPEAQVAASPDEVLRRLAGSL